jgi:hypothetical protein
MGATTLSIMTLGTRHPAEKRNTQHKKNHSDDTQHNSKR